jgi:hypothetical protein
MKILSNSLRIGQDTERVHVNHFSTKNEQKGKQSGEEKSIPGF